MANLNVGLEQGFGSNLQLKHALITTKYVSQKPPSSWKFYSLKGIVVILNEYGTNHAPHWIGLRQRLRHGRPCKKESE